jgi:hypothetical protein
MAMSLEAKESEHCFHRDHREVVVFCLFFLQHALLFFSPKVTVYRGLRWLGLAIGGARVGNESEEALIRSTHSRGGGSSFFRTPCNTSFCQPHVAVYRDPHLVGPTFSSVRMSLCGIVCGLGSFYRYMVEQQYFTES